MVHPTLGDVESQHLDLALGTVLRHVTALADRKDILQGQKSQQDALGFNHGSVGGRFKKAWKPQAFSWKVTLLAPLLNVSAAEGK